MRVVEAPRTPLWVHGSLERMGQILFRPPSVKGWTSGTGWLNSAAVVERFKAARRFSNEFPQAASRVHSLCFDGNVPEALAVDLNRAEGKEKVALAFASPECQLA